MRLLAVLVVVLGVVAICNCQTISLPDVYSLQLSGEDTNSVGFTTYSYYVAQLDGNFMARTDTLDGGFLTSEWSFWNGKDGAPVQHFTLQLDADGSPQCSLEETSAKWSPPITFDNFVYAGKEAPNAAFVPLDSYTSNYTTGDANYIDTWYFLDEYPIYLNSRDGADSEGLDYVVSYKMPGIDDLKPFFDLPSVCRNASRAFAAEIRRTIRRPGQLAAQQSPFCHPTRQTRCCVYLLENDKSQLVFHNNVKNAPSCPPKSGSANLCNERCVSNMSFNTACNRVGCA